MIQVQVAALSCVSSISTLLDTLAHTRLKEIVESNSQESRRGKTIDEFEKFVSNYSSTLLSAYPSRAESYCSSIQVLCKSEMPRVQADSALLLSYVFIHVPKSAQQRLPLANIIKSVTDLCKSPEDIVRSRAVHALGLFAKLD